jgi:glycosyltransferase involved in cell wall biosynthesis
VGLVASIILPVRNAAGTLGEAIGSSLAGSGDEVELLVVVNGSTDGSEEIARGWAARDRRVRVLSSPAEDGVVGASNCGAAAARGEILLRMDADDVAAPGRVAAECGFLLENPGFAAVAGRVEVIDGLGDGMARYVEWVNSLGSAEAIAAGRFIESPVINPSSAVRRAVYHELGGYRQSAWAEDHDLWLRMLAAGWRIGKIPEVVIGWRDSAGRLTRSDARYSEDQVWRMKAHHLARVAEVARGGVAIAGAGPIGKRLARLLAAEGALVRGFFDVSPRRVGQRIGGLEVVGPEWIGRKWAGAAVLAAVGLPGAREQVRGVALRAGLQEGGEFWGGC